MPKASMRTDKEIEEIYERNFRTVYRICYTYMKNTADTEDAVQDTFIRLIRANPSFENDEHEKAWLIRTAANVCKNMLSHWWRKRENPDESADLQGGEAPEKSAELSFVLKVITELPEKYKTVVYLYYFDGYTGPEIAKMLKKPQSTVRNLLHDAREILRERLGDDFK